MRVRIIGRMYQTEIQMIVDGWRTEFSLFQKIVWAFFWRFLHSMPLL